MKLVGAALVGAIFVVIVVASLAALDRTTLHLYWDTREETKSGPAFTQTDVERLTQSAVTSGGFPFPRGRRWVRCTDAQYHPDNHKWVVTCEFAAVQNDPAVITLAFVFDDNTGRVDLAGGR